MRTHVGIMIVGFGAALMAATVGGPIASAATIRTIGAVYGDLETQRVCDATAAIASQCDGRPACVVGIGNGALCGDPAFLTVKKVRIDYRCGRRHARSVIIDEYKNVNIVCQ